MVTMSDSSLPVLLAATGTLFIAFSFFKLFILRSEKRRLQFPPGPPGLPFVGNLFQLCGFDAAKYFANLTSVYGDVIYAHVLGRQFVFLNSAKAALDLFESRSAIYSDRPYLAMAGELVGRENTVLFHPYNNELRRHRKLLANALNARHASQFWPLQEAESFRLLTAILKDPENLISHLRRSAGAVTLLFTYGYKVQSYWEDDHFINLAEEIAEITTKASQPGRWLVDSFPFLRHIPWWCPGAGFKRWALEARRKSEEFTDAPFEYAKSNARSGDGVSSFTTQMLDDVESELGRPPTTTEEQLLRWTSASIYAGGSDTTVALVTSFFLYMAAFPSIQKKAQRELDETIGKDKFASMADIKRLPYIDCLIKELHRFNPIVPLIPHSTLVDNEYRGYLIPKGAWIMANSCAIMHDPNEFPDPERFWPERYEDGLCKVDPRFYSFGYGRRSCPGVNFANSSIFLTVTHTLSAFDITATLNDQGKLEEPILSFTAGHVSHPVPFKCTIKPRSNKIACLISEMAASL